MNLPDPAPFSDLNALINGLDWPVMPEAGQALICTLNDEDADMFTVCQIIKKDPALTAALLRMANSAMFGLSGTVDTLERAVNVVGLSLVRARAMSLCLARTCRFPLGMDRLAFWHYSLRCAHYAQWLAEQCEADDQEAWLCGMMLRLGEITMASARPGCLLKIEAQPVTAGERWVRQRQLIGFDEATVTAEMAQRWDFPKALVLGMRCCAQPLVSAEFSKLAGVLHLAARLADSGPVTAHSVDALPSLLMQLLRLDGATLLQHPPAEEHLDADFFDH